MYTSFNVETELEVNCTDYIGILPIPSAEIPLTTNNLGILPCSCRCKGLAVAVCRDTDARQQNAGVSPGN